MHMNDATNIFELYLESQMTKNHHGTKIWTLHGQVHRIDGPAIVFANGTKEWWKDNKLHRQDGPAIEFASGTKEWHINGKMHREGAPAVEYANGTKEWWMNGKLHRIDGPAVEYFDGNKDWFVDGKEYDDVASWAKMALEYEHKPVTQQNIDAKVAEVMQQDLFD